MSKAIVYGDGINTDLIIAGKYTKTLDFSELAAHCMEDLDPSFSTKIEAGDVLAAGENFGCGSSREQAPLALKYAGVGAVLAKSFARIFYRNAVNVGLPVLVCDTSRIREGDRLELDMELGLVTVNGREVIACQSVPALMRDILESGGLAAFLRREGDFKITGFRRDG